MPQPSTDTEYTYRSDRLGRLAERFVRAFGMPWFLAGQTAVIALWIAVNALVPVLRFDPYPFIFMNLVFSALAAYAAPFILLAQTRQADRDKARSESESRHREQMVIDQAHLLDENRRQTEHIADLLVQMRELLERESDAQPPPSVRVPFTRGEETTARRRDTAR
ncbi:MAG TPA: DUF1003 domain-containing protein [Solirubrobacter sp.]|nr:DUF1003 domain-containing protein [Solirubrobacter sp.]